MACAYWDAASKSFKQTGVSTSVSGRRITCATSHLTAFQIVEDENGVVTASGMNMWLMMGIVLGFCFFIVLLALFMDYVCKRKEQPYYPHIRETGGDSCCKICGYSFLYNFPLISLFTFQDANLRAYARALWLTDLFMLIFLADIILFALDVISFEATYINEAIIGCILGLILIPSSFIIHVLATLGAPVHSRDEREELLGVERPVMTRKARFIKRESGYLTLYLFSLAVYAVTLVMIWKHSDGVAGINYLHTYAIAIGAGLIYAVIKIVVAAIVASTTKDGCCYSACVDVLTDQVAVGLEDNDVTTRYSLPQ